MLGPQAEVAPGEVQRGIRYLYLDAAFATAIGALNSGVVLLALALHLGASTVEIGLLAAIPLLTQVLQAPAVVLVERLRARRLIAVTALTGARLSLPIYAITPFISDRGLAVTVLIFAALVHYGLNAVAACSWNSWIRDLVPRDRLGEFTARRTWFGTVVSVAAATIAAVTLEGAHRLPEWGDTVFFGIYAMGFLCAIISTVALARVPEPEMTGDPRRDPLVRLLAAPLRDVNFRNALRFLATWQFAVNLATPFFTVYIVRELGYSMGFVMVLTVASQLATAAVLRDWGRLGDRFANKSLLSVAAPMFILSIVAMAFAGEFESRSIQSAYLLLLHIFMGTASAGVGLASGNMAMKLSPSGVATSYMATNALVCAVAAGMGPIVGGWAADFLARRELALQMIWRSPAGVRELVGLFFTHWEFFFLLSALVGLYALHRLTAIRETGEVDRRQVVDRMWLGARRSLRGLSSVAGTRLSVAFPGGDVLAMRMRRRKRPRPA